MNQKNMEVSRRAFLAGAVAGAAALSLPACAKESPKQGVSSQPADLPAEQIEASYEVINTDILVLGGGNLGIGAALAAISEGRNVTIIDKGTFRHSGVSGLSWDYFLGQNHENLMKAVAAGAVTENGKAVVNAAEFIGNFSGHNRFVFQVNMGQTLPDRDEAGRYIPFLTPDRTQGQFCRRHNDTLLSSPELNVIDRTMITDLLISNGRCLGAMGIYLPTGDFRVFRANATIIATGGCTWFYGWRGVTPYSINVADNTADVAMAAYRRGAGIVNSEFSSYDVMSIQPEGLTCAFGAGVCGDAQEPHTIYDKNGDLLFDLEDERVWTDRSFFCRYMATAIEEEGRGTENNAIFINIGDSRLRYGNARNIAVLEKFGIKPREEKIEAVPEMYEHGGEPLVDENMMTEIPGLFCGYNFSSGTGVMLNYYFGPYAGHCASVYAEKGESNNEEIDFSGADAEFIRLHGIRTKTTEKGLRPHEVRLAIQEAGYLGMGVYRSTNKLQASIAEFERIRKEDLPVWR